MKERAMIVIPPEQAGSLTDGYSESDGPLVRNKGDNSSKLDGDEPEPVFPAWSRLTEKIVHTQVPNAVNAITSIAVRAPLICVLAVVIVSFTLALVGYATNFEVEVDDLTIFTPFGVRPRSHSNWIDQVFGTELQDRRIFCMIHEDGDNVVSMGNMERVWDVLRVVTETPGYNFVCTKSDYTNPATGLNDCEVSSVSRFWENNWTLFEESVESEDQLRKELSAEVYPDRVPADTATIIGNAEYVNDVITEAQSFFLIFNLPNFEGGLYDTESVELEVPDRLLDLQKKWDNAGFNVNIDFFTERSYETELQRAIYRDLPLVPLVFIIMTIFTCSIFARRDRVQSRMLLGVGAVVTIVMSLLTSYGLMFCFGVPFTNMTQLVPFVIFGVGLDDTFIITGSFARTDPKKPIEERISSTMKDSGLSISVTTLTTSFAFGLGSISNIPAVRWLCLYAIVAIVVDFLYQITFFIALLVLDERRIQSNRGDLCCCCEVEDLEEDQEEQPDKVEAVQPNFIDRFMIWYAEQVMRPCVKVVVLLAFTALFGGCVYSTSKLRQEFKITELLPDDSYVSDFINVFQEYYGRSLPLFVYFRNVDQSDPNIQAQMLEYIDELTALDQFDELDDRLSLCWVKDLPTVLATEQFSYLENNTFTEQIDILFGYREVQEIYGDNIVRDENTGEIIASRCALFVQNLELDVVQQQIDLLHDQRDVTVAQPINEDESEWPFFTFDNLYLTWEFYDAVVEEWIFTTISGVIAVTVICFVCLPHWTAALFVFPMISILYVDLTGTIQLAGLYINVVTHVALAMSIGLLVDYIVHVLLRYYETPGKTREEKVKECLRTMGSAVLVGGLSTFLGVVPLMFSTSEVLRTVFVCFISMVSLGCGHGLILLPVVLSLVGPVNHVPPSGETVLNAIVDVGGKQEAKVSKVNSEKKTMAKSVEKTETANPPAPKSYFLPLPRTTPAPGVSSVGIRAADPPGVCGSGSEVEPKISIDCDGVKEELVQPEEIDRLSAGESSEGPIEAECELKVPSALSEDEIVTISPPNSLTRQSRTHDDSSNGSIWGEVAEKVNSCFPTPPVPGARGLEPDEEVG